MNVAVRREPDAALGLLENVLRAGGDLAREYPLLFGAADGTATHGFATVEEDGAVRSACAFLRRDLAIGPLRVRAGLIGSVATEPAYRGRGFARRALAAAEAELAKAGASVALLWADDADYYSRLGWRPCGAENDYVLTSAHARVLPGEAGVRPRVAADDEALHALHLRHPERTERTLAEMRALLACPDMEVLVCERWGRVDAYACLGRGRDLKDTVHEWAGDARALLAMLRAFLERRAGRAEGGDLYLMSPRSAVDLGSRLRALGVEPVRGVLAMGKVLDLVAFARLAVAALDRRAATEVRLDAGGERVHLVGEKAELVCSRADLLELVFAARGDPSSADLSAEALGLPKGRLPLEPFVWGLDSI